MNREEGGIKGENLKIAHTLESNLRSAHAHVYKVYKQPGSTKLGKASATQPRS